MSEQNVKIVRAVYDSFVAGDVDAVFAAMTPDIKWDESEGMAYGGVYHGREAIVSKVIGPILTDVEGSLRSQTKSFLLDRTRVVALGRHGARGANGLVHARTSSPTAHRLPTGSEARPAGKGPDRRRWRRRRPAPSPTHPTGSAWW